MSYLTVAKLDRNLTVARVNSLVPETGSTRASILQELIDNAASQIDGYLSTRYATPVPESGYIESLCLSLCLYQLYLLRTGGEIPERVVKARDDAVKDLKELADGKRGLGGASPVAPSSTTTSGIAMACDTAVFASGQGVF